MSKVIDYILANQWALDQRVLTNGLAVIARHSRGESATAEQIAAVVAGRDAARAEKLATVPWDGALGRASEEDQTQGYSIQDGVALVPVEGLLTRYASLVNGSSQPRGTSSQAVVTALDNAMKDPRCDAIVLMIDSPGGTVAGVEEMGQAVKSASAQKPVVAWAAYLCCSAAYWVASQADKIVAARTSLVGNIGVYQVLQDTSQAAAAEGVKVHVVKAGQWKAIGVDGAPVTDAQIAVVQDEINAVYRQFVSDVAAGRGMDMKDAYAAADGRAFSGYDARDAKLADRVGNLADAVKLARSKVKSNQSNPSSGRVASAAGNGSMSAKESNMLTLDDLKKSQPEALAAFKAEVTTEVQAAATKAQEAAVAAALKAQAEKPAPAATLAELKAIVPEGMAGRPDLIIGLQEQSATVAAAQSAVIKALADQSKALATENTTLKAAKGLGNEGKGVEALTLSPKPEGTEAGGDFEKLVLGIAASEKITIAAATVKAAEKNEAAHRDWVARRCPKIAA